MKELVVEQISASGDSHVGIVALFTTQEKAEVFLAKCPSDSLTYFYIREHIPDVIPIDPNDISDVWQVPVAL